MTPFEKEIWLTVWFLVGVLPSLLAISTKDYLIPIPFIAVLTTTQKRRVDE